MNDFDSFIDDLVATDVQTLSATKTKATGKFSPRKFKCESCNGTGRWSGGTNSHGNAKCHTCHGHGALVTSADQRAKQRQTEASRKARVADEARRSNLAHGDGELVKFLIDTASWNEFSASLLQQHQQGKSFSEKQVEAARRMWVKVAEQDRERAAKQVAAQVEVDLSPIRAMFETAVASGYKRPTYRAEGLVISRAPDSGSNPGALYVKNEDDVYGGKVLGKTFSPVHDGKHERFTPVGTAAATLALIAEDPLQAAIRYGQRTGKCACCGRELTNHASIDLGIGPICRQKWGL